MNAARQRLRQFGWATRARTRSASPDCWILADQENARKVYAALGEFGAPLAGVSPSDFAADGTIFQIGVAPCRIDVINKIDGVKYAEASSRAIEKTIEGVPVRIISLEDLIANKRASGRTKDLADAEILEGLGK